MFTISQAAPQDDPAIRRLFLEYLHWGNKLTTQLIGFTFDVEVLVDKNMNELNIFMPPAGRLLLARNAETAIGCACMHALDKQIVELKRMYVQPDHRRQGIGGALLDGVIAESRAMGNTTLRLDSVQFMTDAHALYRSKGFREIEPYEGSEIPKEVQHHWLFMELAL